MLLPRPRRSTRDRASQRTDPGRRRSEYRESRTGELEGAASIGIRGRERARMWIHEGWIIYLSVYDLML